MNISFSVNEEYYNKFFSSFQKFIQKKSVNGERVSSQSIFFIYLLDFWNEKGGNSNEKGGNSNENN